MKLSVLIDSLALEALAADCAQVLGLQREQAKDGVLDILSAMLAAEKKYDGAFESSRKLYHYVRIATIRHLTRQQKKHMKSLSLHKEAVTLSVTEQELHTHWPRQELSTTFQQVLADASETASIKTDCLDLFMLLLAHPETYIRIRVSGPDAGEYVFQASKLADALGWTRRKVYDRLKRIRQLLRSIQS